MNTMNKWFVAGLIGLVSTGMAWAVTDLDLNAGMEDQSIHAGYIAGVEDTNPLLPLQDVNGNRELYAHYNGLPVTPNRAITLSSSGSQLTFSAFQNSGGSVGKKVYANAYYRLSSLGADWSWYEGVQIDFATAAASFETLTLNVIDGNSQQVNYQLAGHVIESKTITWAMLDPGGVIGMDFANLQSLTLTYSYGNATALGSQASPVADIISFIGFKGIPGDPLGVPEPETVWMIVAVLASLGVTFRRQLMGMFVKT